jgi:hypothetical protein
MALATTALPLGMRDIRVIPLGADGATPGTAVDLPKAQRMGFAEAEDFEVLRGDDVEQTRTGKGPVVNWTLTAGGISIAALKVMAGGTVTSSGTTPALKQVLSKSVLDARPYFKAEGQAINDNGGDTHLVLYRCRATSDITGEFADGSFWITGLGGIALGSLEAGSLNKLWDIVQNETAISIP